MHGSNLPLRKWVVAFYLMTTNLKGVSSMRIHRELGITQKTAWYMIHRIREAWNLDEEKANGPVEVDEAYMGDRIATKHQNKKIQNANGTVGKTAVVGMKDRKTNQVQAKVVEHTNQETLQGFVNARIAPGAKVYTDEHGGYYGTYHQMSVKHLNRYVNEFSGRHNTRPLDTIDQMSLLALGMSGKRLRYQDLIAVGEGYDLPELEKPDPLDGR